MNIEECKQNMRLPEEGTRVRTVINKESETEGFFVHNRYIDTRIRGVGFYKGFVPGAGGDVWWIEHDDGSTGAYCFDEVFDEVE